jgi:hypothetical protein
MRAMCPAHSILPNLITLTVYRENCIQIIKFVMMQFSLSLFSIFSLGSTYCHRFLLKYSRIIFISQSDIWSLIFLHVYPLLGNELVKKFQRRQILGKKSVARLRNNRGGCIFYVVRPTPSSGNGPMNSQCDMWHVFSMGSVPKDYKWFQNSPEGRPGEFSVEFRGSRTIEQEIARRLDSIRVLLSVLRSVARRWLVVPENPSACTTANCKLCKSAIAL